MDIFKGWGILVVLLAVIAGPTEISVGDFIYVESPLDVDIPTDKSWAGSGIEIQSAPAGATVTSVDVHYEIESSWVGFVYAELSDEADSIAYGLVDGVNGSISQTKTGITAFNDELVNQLWILWAKEEYSSGGGYIDSWWIKLYYDSGPPTYCGASGGCDEYISRVEVGSIDNSSECDGYYDYTAISTEMQIGQNYDITVTNGNPYQGQDLCGIWVDWNQDKDFDDPDETITVTGSPGDGPYTATITPPADANLGETRMRTRIVWNQNPDSCGDTNYGEVEDYTITVAAAQQALTVSGYVKTEGGTAIEGVLMTGTNGAGTDTTDGNGFYELTLPTNPWTGTITPSKACWSFEPASRGYSGLNYDVTEANFTGTGTCFYGGGLGSQQNPFLIYTAEHMQEIGTHPDHWDMCFKLMEDIDLAEYTGEVYNIIGYYIDSFDNEPFSGIFDGNGHTIYNFTYSSTSRFNVGIFGYVSGFGAEIKKLGLVNPVIAGSGSVVGALVGWSSNATINNCYVAGGSVSGANVIGGLVGQVGFFGNTTIYNCYTDITVSGNDAVGGLCGWVFDGTISNCYSAGSVSGTGNVGGLVGDNQDTIENSFWDIEASGQVSGVGAGSSSGALGKTTAQMQTQSTFTDAGWDFSMPIWKMCQCADYPRLAWETVKYGGGRGTATDPYLICVPEHMQSIGADSDDWDKHFKLTADIDLSAYTGTQFNIIGSQDIPFSGVFDGNGHVISNFTYGPTNSNKVGLFGVVEDWRCIIKNLGLVGVDIDTTGYDTGAIVARLQDEAQLINCYVKNGSIEASNYAGGLVGANIYGIIIGCEFEGIIDASSTVGGLVGYSMDNGSIWYCCSKGTVIGFAAVGGLVGENSISSIISSCYSLSDVQRGSSYLMYFGGLVGANHLGIILDSYAKGNVTGGSNAGGFVGVNGNTISHCYSTGYVSGTTAVGGFAGVNNDTIVDSFWDIETSNQNNGVGSGSLSGLTGKTTVEMQTEDTFTTSGWDFSVEPVWKICEGTNYPKLAWQISLLGDFVCPDGVEIEDLDIFTQQWLMEKLSADVAAGGGDGIVDFLDWAVFANTWQNTSDIVQVLEFAQQWLHAGAYCADIAPPGGDGAVDMLDFAVLAENWLKGIGQ